METTQNPIREFIRVTLEDTALQMIQEHARELVQVARDDQTIPTLDPVQKRFSGWKTDELLLQIEHKVLRDDNDPGTFAEICALAGQELAMMDGVAPAVPVIVALGVLNGRRRLSPAISDFETEIRGIIWEIKAIIARLPQDTRRDRCEQFLLYQRGIFLEACGRFDEAAEIQKQAAQLAEKIGDTPLAGISRFRVLVHRANQAFFTGEGTNEAVGAIINAVPALQSAVRDTPLAVQWGVGNAYAHVLLALIWNDQACVEEWDEFAILFLDQAPLLGPQFEDHLALMQAVDINAEDELVKLIASKSSEVGATALLTMARIAVFDKDVTEEARQYYDQIPATGNVRHIRAIAERELAALDCEWPR